MVQNDVCIALEQSVNPDTIHTKTTCINNPPIVCGAGAIMEETWKLAHDDDEATVISVKLKLKYDIVFEPQLYYFIPESDVDETELQSESHTPQPVSLPSIKPVAPPRAFALFSEDYYGKVLEVKPDADHAEIKQILGDTWVKLDDATKAKYNSFAAELKAQYDLEMNMFQQ